MQIHGLPIRDVFTTLHTSSQGLGDDEAARRLRAFGPNEPSPSRRISLRGKLVRQVTHFLTLLLWLAALLAYLVAYLQPGEGMGTLAHALVGVLIINALFSFFQEY